MCKTQSPYGRKIIMVGTASGNVVVFGRYNNESSSVVVSNTPSGYDEEVRGSLSAEQVAKIFSFNIPVEAKPEPAPAASNTAPVHTAPIAPVQAKVTPAPAVQQESSFDWAGVAKTTGLFVAGAAGKMIWDHFFD